MNGRSYEQQRPIYAAASQLVTEAGLEVYSLLDEFVATGRRPWDYRINLVDEHPGVEYNKVAARVVFDRLREIDVLPGIR